MNYRQTAIIESKTAASPQFCNRKTAMQIVAVPMFRSVFSASIALSLISPAVAGAADRPKQLVIVSFDGAHDNALWQKSREMAAKNSAHFTYFLSCTFLMNQEAKKA
jgi:hypothetical protein